MQKKQKITPFLMFVQEVAGKAEEAMNFYTSIFEDSEIIKIDYHENNPHEISGSVLNGVLSLKGQTLIFMDSNAPHPFGFNPSFSLFVECDTEEEIKSVYEQLSKNGEVLMALDTYPFAEQFGWVADQFGISWQLVFNQ